MEHRNKCSHGAHVSAHYFMSFIACDYDFIDLQICKFHIDCGATLFLAKVFHSRICTDLEKSNMITFH